MKIKDKPQPISTQDFFYDLFDGGYIEPDEQLVQEDAQRVLDAIAVILEYRAILEDHDLVEYN